MFLDDADTAGVDRAIRCLERSIDFGSVIIEFTKQAFPLEVNYFITVDFFHFDSMQKRYF